MKVYLQNFGCKVNQIETDSLAVLLQQHGWECIPHPTGADAVVLNSCTVTASGDHRMLTALRRLRKQLPHAIIAVTGCYVQAFPDADLPEADIRVGTKERAVLPKLLETFLLERSPAAHIPPHKPDDPFESLPLGSDSTHTRAFLKIQDGCNRFCSYCIIPFARGRCRSLPLLELSARSAILFVQGYQEIVLCGINLACYGEAEGLTIADAVEACAESGFRRIRLGSLEPDGLTEEVLARLAACPALCPQFHISLQSGCDRTLRAMRRRYTCADYAALLDRIRRAFPDCAVTTDIMTGFPGETDADFAETLAFAGRMQFAKIHIFRYSPRSGTTAASLPEQVPEAVKKTRADALAAVAADAGRAFLEGQVGRTCEVLFERERGDGLHRGRTKNGVQVVVPAKEEASFRNRILSVRIDGISGDAVVGCCVNGESL